ncbi:MAG TPA: ATPase [Lachnospiraceae bacterium]|nr:ATPase [Lachnospiraceae bacterium]
MELSEIQNRVAELEQQISNLPAGSITKKTVNGKEYFYHRWTEDKKRKEKYIPVDELENFHAQIEQRKKLDQDLKALKKQLPKTRSMDASMFTTNVRTGETLRSFAKSVRGYRRRECFQQLYDYVYGDPQDKVFILYGLRRTGKTTMIRQIFAEMRDTELVKAAFIQITAKDTLADVNRDLKILEAHGFRYVFLDEVTLMEDFIEGAALFSDVFAACGMKIVLSGTDSLGFLFTEDEQLYDRCVLLHTTFIPYREFETVLGIHGIDEYIRYGGTMSLGGIHYNENSTFASKKKTDEYVDTAIARNIQHSLRCYQYEGHFRHLRDLYDKNELTSAINRVVEDINHRFTLEVLTQDWKSHDLGISASNLRRDRENPTDILDRIDLVAVTSSLRKLLEIRNKAEQTIELDDIHVAEIKEYLDLLDLTREIDVLHLPDVSTKSSRTVIAQPGLRYAQADELIRSLLLDETFSALSLAERTVVQERILTEIKGRMLEDIVLLETKLTNLKKQVFVLQFPIGEFDMVVFDPEAGSCQIFEIKHSEEAVSQQYRHLVNEEKCAQTEHRYGSITGKFVLYRGKSRVVDGIPYQNVEEYLRNLGDNHLKE